MKFSRRAVLQIGGFGVAALCMLPRVAFAARNALKNVRTGNQPDGKTRLVIETAVKPSYSLTYSPNQLTVGFANTAPNKFLKPNLANGTLVKSITQTQTGDRIDIIANLNSDIAEIPKSQIMILEPNGDNDYRLVLDFAAGKRSTSKPTNKTSKSSVDTSKKYIVVIDAGHGGKDPGCIGRNGTQEKTIVLSVAKKLKSRLESNGFKTYLTRSDDRYLKLAERAEIAEKRKADLFLSLHANANPKRTMKGFSIYTLSEKASDEEAKKLAESENAADKIGVNGFSDFEPNIRSALSALQQHAVAEMSEEYASGCSRAFVKSNIEQQPGPDVRHAPFAVLRSTVPGALIELGHLSNPDEEKLLQSANHQDKLVESIVKSVKNYNFDV